MIDLHCHILPGIDDGAPDFATSLAMARIALDDGIETTACTPHIYPGMYENDAHGIRRGIEALSQKLIEHNLPLKLIEGADTHVVPQLVHKLRDGLVPTLNSSRYFLLEPPHHTPPPHFDEYVFNILAAGYVPIITHPERLRWIEDHYPSFVRMAQQGVWMQLTAGSLIGHFGSRPKYWSERMINEGLVHILASDGHGSSKRLPQMSAGRDAAEKLLGAAEARHLVWTRPLAVVNNDDQDSIPPIPAMQPKDDRFDKNTSSIHSLFSRFFRKQS